VQLGLYRDLGFHVTTNRNTGYTQNNGAVSMVNKGKPHHSFVYILYLMTGVGRRGGGYKRSNNNNNNNNATQTQTLSSLTDVSVHIRSSPFAVSVHTLQSPIYTSSSPSPVSSCQRPVDGCPAPVDIFSSCGKLKMFLRTVRNVLFL
jgi:hypothetical protein